jgi:hypothetical protein
LNRETESDSLSVPGDPLQVPAEQTSCSPRLPGIKDSGHPGESADRPEAVLAVKTMKRCRMEIRQTLGLRENY